MFLAWEALTQLIPDLFIGAYPGLCAVKGSLNCAADTMGYAFTFHVASVVGNVPVGAYVHYPTISTTMLARVQSRTRNVTNSDAISSSSVLSRGKLLYVLLVSLLNTSLSDNLPSYYRIFMYYYAHSLRQARFIMVNSSWTKNHVDAILRHSDPLLDVLHYLPPLALVKLLSIRSSDSPKSAPIVYPPCDTRELAKFPLHARERVILSIAQFR